MARAIWTGAISFGMVTIPVRLSSSAQSKDFAFHLLHTKDNARIHNKRWCDEDDEEVPSDEIVKGYEFAKGEYVIVTDEELEKLPVPSKHTIDVMAFVDEDDIQPEFYERSYFLEPDEAGVKGFRLLMTALEKRDLVAIGKIAFRQREHLCALRPSEGGIVLETLYWADEIRERPKVPKSEVSKRELDMAFSLVDLLRADFKPEQYEDEYRVALQKLIEAKQQGKEIIEEAPAPQDEKIVDLMAALKASVEKAKGAHPAAKKRAANPKRKAS
jgi:DNA end-binding protein Ku